MSLLKPSVKALMLSSRISLRTDKRGFLSMQYMIKTEDGQVCFVEYFVSIRELSKVLLRCICIILAGLSRIENFLNCTSNLSEKNVI